MITLLIFSVINILLFFFLEPSIKGNYKNLNIGNTVLILLSFFMSLLGTVFLLLYLTVEYKDVRLTDLTNKGDKK